MRKINYKIHQTHADWAFWRYSFAQTHGFDFKEYNEVYSSSIEAEDNSHVEDICEELFYIFNEERPSDFFGHSLSVSDIVEIDGRYYYCDSFGFKEITVDILNK